jgi:hypothetical protein
MTCKCARRLRAFPAADNLESFQCVHVGIQELDSIPQFRATAKLSQFLEARFSQSF